MSDLLFVSDVVARLRQRFGVAADFYRPLTTAAELTTGIQSRDFRIYRVQAVLLPYKLHSIFSYDAAYNADRQGRFSMGGKHDKTERSFIVDLKTLIPTLSDFVVVKANKYMIKDAQIYEDLKIASLVICRGENVSEKYFNIHTELDLQ